MELDTCAVIGRLNLPGREGQTHAPSSYNISRLGLAPTPAGPSPSALRPPEVWPVVVAEPIAPPACDEPAHADNHPTPLVAAGPRRKTSFALPAELLDHVRARATVTGEYQYVIVSQALDWFFHQQLGLLSTSTRRGSLGGCVWRLLTHWRGRGRSQAR